MNARVDLSCDICGEDFLVPAEVYAANSCVVQCPCCGSTDLVLLGETWSGDRRAPATAA